MTATPRRTSLRLDQNQYREEEELDQLASLRIQRVGLLLPVGFSAVIITALTPNASAELWVEVFRNRNLGTTAERTRVNPDSSRSLNISPSGRAPPIQLAQSFGSFTID